MAKHRFGFSALKKLRRVFVDNPIFGRRTGSNKAHPSAVISVKTPELEEYPTAEIVISSDSNGINTLPSELLSYIFILGSEEYLKIWIVPGADKDCSYVDFTTLCSHICSYWRNVALGTPQLWAYIDFEEDCPFERSWEWISRSKAVPLTLKIFHYNYLPEDSEEDSEENPDLTYKISIREQCYDLEDISSMIIPHAHRWRSLEIVADYRETFWFWGKRLEKCPVTPRLEYLRLSCYDHRTNEELLYPDMLFLRPILPLGAPRLTTVDIRGVNIDWKAGTVLMGLKSLKLAYHGRDVRPSVGQFVHMLEQSPDMEELLLVNSAPYLGYWPQGSISLNNLHTLAIEGIDLATAISIVDHLKFPALRDLVLDLGEDDSVEPFITAVCHRKRPRFRDVEVLKLISFPCQQQAAVQFLKSMPKITSMTLDFTCLTKCFYNALLQDTVSSPIVCRRLNILSLSGLDDEELRNLVVTRGRSRDVASIRQLYYRVDDSTDHEEWLEKNMGHVEFFEPEDDGKDGKDEEGEEEDEED